MLCEVSVAMTSLTSTWTGPAGAAGAGTVESTPSAPASRVSLIRRRKVDARTSGVIPCSVGRFPADADNTPTRPGAATARPLSFGKAYWLARALCDDAPIGGRFTRVEAGPAHRPP